MFNNYKPVQHCNYHDDKQRQCGFLKEQIWDQCLKILSMKKSSRTSIIEYTTLKRAYITTKDPLASISSVSLTNRTLKIFTDAIYMRLIETRY